MIEEPRVIETVAQRAAVIRMRIAPADIEAVMGPAIGEVMATVMGQGVTPTGAVFSHYYAMNAEVWDLEVGVTVASPVTPQGRVTNGELPAVTAARTIYRGPYDGLGEAWGAMTKWVVERGHTPSAELWESYLTDPGASPDPATWETELTLPLVS